MEYLRYGLDRARSEDFDDDEAEIRDAVGDLLRDKPERDFGETKGTLLPNYEILLDLTIAERKYRVRRSPEGISVTSDPDTTGASPAALDVRTLVSPRILSQRQIARIARDPAAQRRELDALAEPAVLRSISDARASVLEEIEKLQSKRKQLQDRADSLPIRQTELRKVRDKIAVLEKGGNKETLDTYQAFQNEQRWISQSLDTISSTIRGTNSAAPEINRVKSRFETPPVGPCEEWIKSVSQRLSGTVQRVQDSLKELVKELVDLRTSIASEQRSVWQPEFERAKKAYEQLRSEMQRTGADFAQHEALLNQRNDLQTEILQLQGVSEELESVEGALRDARTRLVQLDESRLAQRRELAAQLESAGADIRLEIVPFGDRADFLIRKDAWFPLAGLQDRDWEVLSDFVFRSGADITVRLHRIVDALRSDTRRIRTSGRPLESAESATAELLGSEFASRLTKNFFNALQKADRIRLDEMERFLPEDLIEAKVRAADGGFKPISQGSVGQKSMAVVSLLLSAGDQPLIIDQPEDDLDNQYVYGVIVDLLRKRKFSRQIIVATHNANIPVNGDAELIVAFGVQSGLGSIMCAGSIDSAQMKDLVSVIMEGSAEAFRLRRERYGY